MTIDEAFAAVREAFPYSWEDAEEFQMPMTLAGYEALAIIENQLAYYKVSSDGRSAAVTRAEKAEDDLIGALLAIETWTRREQKQHERVRELEAALKKAKVEAEALREHYTTLVHQHYHARKEAEAERDEYAQQWAEVEEALHDYWFSQKSMTAGDAVRKLLAERDAWMRMADGMRVAELEEALRDLLNEGIDDIDPRLRYVMMQVGRETLAAARRALQPEAPPQAGDLLVIPYRPGDVIPAGWTVEGDKMWRRADGTEAGRALGGGS